MSDRVAIMRDGRIEQLGSPTELYQNPSTTFVANFLGQSNLVAGTVGHSGAGVTAVEAHGARLTLPADRCRTETGPVILGVRPEKVQLVPAGEPTPEGHNALEGGIVTDTSFIGVSTQYLVRMPWGAELSVFEQNTGRPIQRPGARVTLHWDASQGFGLDGRQDIEAGAGLGEEG